MDAPPHGEPLRPLVVLVLASSSDIRQLVSMVLERDGYAVLRASRAQDGLRQLHHQRPDLIVVDDEFDSSGWEVLSRIRETSDAPVLLLTALTTDTEKLASLDTSNEDYLMKPFARAWLPEKLRALTVRNPRTFD